MSIREIINLIELRTPPEDGSLLLFLRADEGSLDRKDHQEGFGCWDEYSFARARHKLSDLQHGNRYVAYVSFNYELGEEVGPDVFWMATPLGWFDDNSTFEEVAAAVHGVSVSVQ